MVVVSFRPAWASVDVKPDSEVANTMYMLTLQQCAIKTAVLNLVDENVLTRIAIKESDIDDYAKPIRLPPGDPKIKHLTRIIPTLKLDHHYSHVLS